MPGNFCVKKRILELIMGILLLIGLYTLSQEAAQTMESLKNTKPLIMIDCGHGGEDPGMIGVDNLKEKDINLAISLKLRDCLKSAGYQVVMTREKDQGLYDAESSNKKAQDMQRRCEMIAEYEPMLTVSIHQNSYPDSSVRGPQVFYYKDSLEGEKLAVCIQDKLNEKLEIERPRVPKGNTSYYLLKKSKGILNIVECGFLTNPEEAKLLTEESYQEQVAQAIADGIGEYVRQQEDSQKKS